MCDVVQLELLITAATFCITIVGVISGIFGMNLNNGYDTLLLKIVEE